MRARTLVAVALLAAGLSTTGAAAAAPPGTVEDGRTGLLWVADPQFAVATGFAPDVVMPRARAVRMVAAMNAGRLPGFGRHDWRLPTSRELGRWLRRQGLTPPPRAGSQRVWAWPVAGAATLPGVAGVAVLATNSVHLHRNAIVRGDVVVNDASPGPTLAGTAELRLDRQSRVEGDVLADTLRLDQQSVVTGDAFYNGLANGGIIHGTATTPLPLPVFALLPVFHTATPRPGAPDVAVAPGETRVLAAGDYGQITVAARGRLVLDGGLYDVRGISLQGASGCPLPCAAIDIAAPAQVRVAQRVSAATASAIGPPSGSGVDAADVIVYVGGIDGATGALGATPAAVAIGRGARIAANVYAPHGSILFERDASGRGAFLARDVRLGQGTVVELASWFVNRPPVAIPGSATTHGAAPITIALRGSDPDHDDLTFAIAAGPSHGTLGPVVELPPPVEPGDPERPQGDPPRTEATVTYTPAGADDVEDSFVFRVTDTAGGSGTAVVRINPPDGEEPPPGDATTVVALDSTAATVVDRPVTVSLTAQSPAGVDVTFAIPSGGAPARGTLGAVTPGSESPARSASVVYTPDPGTSGVDTFQFTACGVVAGVTVCDSGSAAVVVTPDNQPAELAPDHTVAVLQNGVVAIGLGSPSGSTGAASSVRGSVRLRPGRAIALDPAEVAGNVADADGNGLGDNYNDNLAAGAPVFVHAGVGMSGGPGSNGTVRIQIEWDIAALGPLGTDTGASVYLTTNRGSVDSLDTVFFAGTGGDGVLHPSDFEATLERLPGVVMPVTGAQGADGTFGFDVRDALQSAIAADASFFTVQARVDESLAAGRGLGVYSTADNSLTDGKTPALVLSSPPPLPPTIYTVSSLPTGGLLKDSQGNIITTVPYVLPDSKVSYLPNAGFLGADGFSYQAELGQSIDTGIVSIFVNLADCATTPAGCDNGR